MSPESRSEYDVGIVLLNNTSILQPWLTKLFDSNDGSLLRSQPYMHMANPHDISISVVWGGGVSSDSEFVFLI